MSPPTNNPYPNASEGIQQIINLTEGQDCIFRGESAHYKDPCSSTLYRQLKRVNATPRSIPGLLKKRQNKLIEQMRPHEEEGKNDLERLMACQHKRAKTNLLDFTGDYAVALFFACSDYERKDESGQVFVKQSSTFPKLETEKNELPEDKTVLLEPPKRLKRAKDQKGVLIHVPGGSLPVAEGETVVIKAEWKQEIVEYLEKMNQVSHETLFDDIEGVIERQDREIKQSAFEETQASTSLKGFAKPKDNQTILIMESYIRLLMVPTQGLYRELLKDHAKVLVARLTDVLKRNPQDTDTYFNRAFIHHSKPDFDYTKAISDYTRVIELKPDYPEAYNNRGTVYMTKPNPDYERAISDCDYAIKLDPGYAIAYINRGAVRMSKLNPDCEQAISDYDRALELNPRLTVGYFNRGLAYAQKPNPDYELAISDFTRALELNPDLTDAYINRGAMYVGKPNPDYELAISDYTRAIKLNPRLAMAYNNRGNAYRNELNPNYHQAIRDYDRAFKLNPSYVKAYRNRGVAHANKPDPDYELAISDYTRAIELRPDYTVAYLNRGNAYKNKSNPDYTRAISDYDRAIKLNPKYAKAYNNRGNVYSNMPKPDYDQAIRDFTRAIEQNLDSAIFTLIEEARIYENQTLTTSERFRTSLVR